MLTNLACVLGVSAFQLLVPTDKEAASGDKAYISGLLETLRQNIQDDINNNFNRLL